MMNIHKIIKESLIESEKDDLSWMDEIPAVDVKDPQPGYNYRYIGYSETFDNDAITDNIVIKRMGFNIYFDTKERYWESVDGEYDRINFGIFVKLIDLGEMVFINNGELNESDDSEWGWADDIKPTIKDFFNHYFNISTYIDYITIEGTNNPNDKRNLLRLFESSGYDISRINDGDIEDIDEYLWVSHTGNIIISGEIEDEYTDEDEYGSEYLIDYEDYEDFMRTGITDLNESDDLSWMDDVPTEISVDSINLFYNRPFHTHRRETHRTTYFLKDDERPQYVKVCWDNDSVGGTGCAYYSVKDVVRFFNEGIWYWVN